MTGGRFWKRLAGSRHRYVAVTTLVSLIAFGRNLLFMRTLPLAEIGQVVMMQTLIMLVGFLPLGLINGAYMQYASQDPATNRRLVPVMAGLLGLLGVSVMGLGGLVLAGGGLPGDLVSAPALGFGLAAGVATLVAGWLNNTLIADRRLGLANAVGIGAVLVSLAVAALSRGYGLQAALLSLLLQPLAAWVAILILVPALRPVTLIPLVRAEDRALVVRVLKLGLVPFLAGLAVLLMYQVERWVIALMLGPEALGQFYLVLMYSTFFVLVPAALLNVYFPTARAAHGTGDLDRMGQMMRSHARDLMIYFGLAILVTALLMQPVVDRVFPETADQTHLVYLALPGLVLFTLRDLASLVAYSTGKTRCILISGATTLGAFALLLGGLSIAGAMELENILIVRAAAMVPGTAYLLYERHRQWAEAGRKG